MMKVKIEGEKAFLSLKNMEKATDSGIRKAFFFSGTELKKQVNRLILDPPKTGKVYRINNRNHRTSAPGEAPANLKGVLRRSIGFEVKGSQQLILGASAPYAKFLEFGTSKMNPRPYLIPAIYKQQTNMIHFFEKWINEEIKS